MDGPDLSRSITMHPHPFHLHPNRPESVRSGTPIHHTTSRQQHGAATTAYEPMTGAQMDGPHDPPSHPHARQSHNFTTVHEQELHDNDLEAAGLHPPRYSQDVNDPYRLQSAYKTAHDLQAIRANTSRKRDGCGPVTFTKDARKARKVEKFYETQNENIQRMLKPVHAHVADARQEQGDNHLKFQIAVYGSFVANVVLSGLQLYGAISSGSLSLFTTMADAIFDPLSNVTLIVTNRAVSRVDPRRFPSGKARLETVGNITFCFIMTAVSCILIAFSARSLAVGAEDETTSFHLPSVIAVSIAFVTKLGLFLYCWAIKDKYSQINILWQDHRNDLLINGFGLLTSVGGSKLKWFIDPMGAIILSLIVAFIWLRTAFAEFLLLVGVSASTEMHQLITYICVTHSPDIKGIDTVRCYHSGPRLIAEVDIVMEEGRSLRETHDVAEELERKLESLPDVERAYVHVDWEVSHKPEHGWKKDL